jgi:hypothetical protein
MAFLGHVATRIINEVKGGEPGGLRRDVEAAGDDRVAVGGCAARGDSSIIGKLNRPTIALIALTIAVDLERRHSN